MSTQRRAVISDITQEKMEQTLSEVLNRVAAGSLPVEAARSGLLYLIASIDNGEPNEIKTWTDSINPYLRQTD